MPVIDRRGKPLPPTHSFAAPRVILGPGRQQRPRQVPPAQPVPPTRPHVDGCGDLPNEDRSRGNADD
jgi:hypothetical protein